MEGNLFREDQRIGRRIARLVVRTVGSRRSVWDGGGALYCYRAALSSGVLLQNSECINRVVRNVLDSEFESMARVNVDCVKRGKEENIGE